MALVNFLRPNINETNNSCVKIQFLTLKKLFIKKFSKIPKFYSDLASDECQH
jgi:hypothetical protein